MLSGVSLDGDKYFYVNTLQVRGSAVAYDDRMGARPLGRVIQENIKKPLAEELLFGRLTKGGVVKVKLEDDKLVLDITGPDAPRIGKSKPPLLTAD